jgi:hypothetical protein
VFLAIKKNSMGLTGVEGESFFICPGFDLPYGCLEQVGGIIDL